MQAADWQANRYLMILHILGVYQVIYFKWIYSVFTFISRHNPQDMKLNWWDRALQLESLILSLAFPLTFFNIVFSLS